MSEREYRDQRRKVTRDIFRMSEEMYPYILQDIFRRQLGEDLYEVRQEAFALDIVQRVMHDPGLVLAVGPVVKVVRLHDDENENGQGG